MESTLNLALAALVEEAFKDDEFGQASRKALRAFCDSLRENYPMFVAELNRKVFEAEMEIAKKL